MPCQRHAFDRRKQKRGQGNEAEGRTEPAASLASGIGRQLLVVAVLIHVGIVVGVLDRSGGGQGRVGGAEPENRAQPTPYAAAFEGHGKGEGEGGSHLVHAASG